MADRPKRIAKSKIQDPNFVYDFKCDTNKMTTTTNSPRNKTIQRQNMVKSPEKLFYDESWQRNENGPFFKGYCNAKFYTTRIEEWKEKSHRYHKTLYESNELNLSQEPTLTKIEGGYQLKVEELDKESNTNVTYVMISFYLKRSIVIVNGLGFLRWIKRDYPKLLAYINTGSLDAPTYVKDPVPVLTSVKQPVRVTEDIKTPNDILQLCNNMSSPEPELLRSVEFPEYDSDFEDVNEHDIEEVLLVHNSPQVAVSKLKDSKQMEKNFHQLQHQNESLNMKVSSLMTDVDDLNSQIKIKHDKYVAEMKENENSQRQIDSLLFENTQLKLKLEEMSEEKQVLQARLESMEMTKSTTTAPRLNSNTLLEIPDDSDNYSALTSSKPINHDELQCKNRYNCLMEKCEQQETEDPLPPAPDKQSACNNTSETTLDLIEKSETCHAVPPTTASPKVHSHINTCKQIEGNTQKDFLFVNGVKNPLSNFYMTEITTGISTYASAEHAFQAKKAAFYADSELTQSIKKAKTAAEARNLAQVLKPNEKWDKVKYAIMKHVLNAKLAQCQEFRAALENTTDKYIIHKVSDKIWGSGKYDETNHSFSGENKLGELLMEIADEIKPKKSKSQEGDSKITKPAHMIKELPQDDLCLLDTCTNTSQTPVVNKCTPSKESLTDQAEVQHSNVVRNKKKYRQKDFLVIGDSNLKGVRENMNKMQQHFNGGRPCVIANGGDRVEDIKNRLIRLIDDKTNLSGCVIHAGTNNVLQGDDKNNIVTQLKTCTEVIRDKCPEAIISIFSIPPVKNNFTLTQEIMEINNELGKMCEDMNVEFVNYVGKHFFKNSRVDARLFGRKSNIHLNHWGTEILEYYIIEQIDQSQKRRCYGCNSTRHLVRNCPYKQDQHFAYRCNVCGVRSADRNHTCF